MITKCVIDWAFLVYIRRWLINNSSKVEVSGTGGSGGDYSDEGSGDYSDEGSGDYSGDYSGEGSDDAADAAAAGLSDAELAALLILIGILIGTSAYFFKQWLRWLRGRDKKPNDKKPNDKKPDDKKPDDKKPDDKKPDDKKPDDKKPNDKKPDDKKPNDKKPNDFDGRVDDKIPKLPPTKLKPRVVDPFNDPFGKKK